MATCWPFRLATTSKRRRFGRYSLLQSFLETRGLIKRTSEIDLRKKHRALEQQFQALGASDFRPPNYLPVALPRLYSA